MLLVTLRMFYKFVHCIIGHACRFKVVGSLCKKCPTPKEAEAHFLQVSQVSSSSSQSLSQVSDSNDESSLSLCEAAVQTETGVAIQSQRCQTQLSLQPSNGENDELLALSGSFAQLMLEKKISILGDYLVHSASAMVQLSCHGRAHVLYNLAKGIGTHRQDGSDSCFPCKRMPMGLLEYMADFFSYKNINLVCLGR